MLLTVIIYLVKVTAIELGENRRKRVLAIENLHAAVIAIFVLPPLYILQALTVDETPFLGGYFFSSFGISLSKCLLAASVIFVIYASNSYLRRNNRHLLEYPITLLLSVLLLLCLVGANNLMTLFLTIGGFSMTLYVLILFDLYARATREAAIKYFYLSAISAGLIIYGTLLLYCVTGTAAYAELRVALSNCEITSVSLVSVGLLFIIFGLFFKLSAFPTHL